jgi:hypothetical protein
LQKYFQVQFSQWEKKHQFYPVFFCTLRLNVALTFKKPNLEIPKGCGEAKTQFLHTSRIQFINLNIARAISIALY